jgi:hypothetical protein
MSKVIDASFEFEKEQETIKRNVMELLIKYPECKSDDDILEQLYHFHIDGLKNFVPISVIQKLTNNNSIERSRRKIMEIARRKLNKSSLTLEQIEYWKQFLPSEETEEVIELKTELFKNHFKKREYE